MERIADVVAEDEIVVVPVLAEAEPVMDLRPPMLRNDVGGAGLRAAI